MATYTWPLGLPQVPEKSYSETLGVRISRLAMASGPAKLRLLGDRPDELSLVYFMNEQQVQFLEDFTRNTLRISAPFNFPHPRKNSFTSTLLAQGLHDIPREQLSSVVSSLGSYTDDLGILNYSKLNEPRFENDQLLVEGAFTNSILGSNTFSGAGWSRLAGGTGTLPVLTPFNATGPDNVENSASTILFDKGAGNTTTDNSSIGSTAATVTGQSVYSSIWVRSVLPGAVYQFKLDLNGADSNVVGGLGNITVTDKWTKFKVGLTSAADTSRRVTLRLRGLQSTSNSAEVEIFNGTQVLNTSTFHSDIITPAGLTASRIADTIYYKSYLDLPLIVECRLINSTEKLYDIKEISPNYYSISLKLEVLP